MVNGHRIRDDACLRAFEERLIEHCFHIDLEFYRKRPLYQVTAAREAAEQPLKAAAESDWAALE